MSATGSTEVVEDPFAVSLDEKVGLLMAASARLQGVQGVTFAESTLDFYRRRTSFASSEGAS